MLIEPRARLYITMHMVSYGSVHCSYSFGIEADYSTSAIADTAHITLFTLIVQ
jgi:hypothetical protein